MKRPSSRIVKEVIGIVKEVNALTDAELDLACILVLRTQEHTAMKKVRTGKPLRQEEMKVQAKLRPANFFSLDARKQWEIDKELGILDWDGK